MMQARNQLLELASQSSGEVAGVRPNGLEDTPMFHVNVDAKKLRPWAFHSRILIRPSLQRLVAAMSMISLTRAALKSVCRADTPFRMLRQYKPLVRAQRLWLYDPAFRLLNHRMDLWFTPS